MIANKIFMIRPAHFGFNPETAVNNVFQQKPTENNNTIQHQALREFDAMVELLRTQKIQVDVLHDNPSEKRFDAIFPNNWFSTHPDQSLVTYPMFSPIRRRERVSEHIRYITDQYEVLSHLALEYYERKNLFLEGTGSLIIDHEYGLVYGNRSDRTHDLPFMRFCQKMGYTPVLFDASDHNEIPIYHTNVLMGIGRGYVIINKSAVSSVDWSRLSFYFHQTDKEVIEINHEQMSGFLGNSAFLHNADRDFYVVMSDTAYRMLSPRQKTRLSNFGTILHSDLSTIERIGGGSAKCMIAENYLNPRWPDHANT